MVKVLIISCSKIKNRIKITFGNLCPEFEVWLVELGVLALELVDLFVEGRLDLQRLELTLLQGLQTTLHWSRQSLREKDTS